MGSFNATHWIIVGLIFFVAYKVFYKGPTAVERHCMTCGTDGPARTETRGSIWIEVVLWLALIVPGLIYSIWRLTTKRRVCAACGSSTVVPFDSPAAISHRKTLAAP